MRKAYELKVVQYAHETELTATAVAYIDSRLKVIVRQAVKVAYSANENARAEQSLHKMMLTANKYLHTDMMYYVDGAHFENRVQTKTFVCVGKIRICVPCKPKLKQKYSNRAESHDNSMNQFDRIEDLYQTAWGTVLELNQSGYLIDLQCLESGTMARRLVYRAVNAVITREKRFDNRKANINDTSDYDSAAVDNIERLLYQTSDSKTTATTDRTFQSIETESYIRAIKRYIMDKLPSRVSAKADIISSVFVLNRVYGQTERQLADKLKLDRKQISRYIAYAENCIDTVELKKVLFEI